MVKVKKIILWTVAGILALVLVAVITGLLLLKYSPSFHASLLHRVEQSLEQSTGARLTVRDFKIDYSGLQLDLYGIVVRGTEPATERPLLTADHLGIALKIDSLLGRKWHLRNLTADHPVASVYVNKAGENNLPKPEKTSSSQTSIFDLAVQQAAIHRGEVYYNDQKTGMDALLNNVEFGAAFDRTQTRYSGSLRYNNGDIEYGAYAPVVHDLDAKFELTPQTFTLNYVLIKTGSSRLTLEASIQDYSTAPRLQAHYDALLITHDVARILKNPSLPAGDLRLTGVLDYQSQPGRPMLEGVKLSGVLSSHELQVVTSEIRAPLRDLKAHYALDHGNASVDSLHAQIMGGTLNGGLTVRDLAGAQQGKFHVALQNVSLDQALPRNQTVQQAALSGRLNADAEGTWAKSLKNLLAHANASIQAALGQNPRMPLNGVIHANYYGATEQLEVRQSYLRTPQTSMTLDGKVSNNSQLQVRMVSADLHELELLAASFRAAAPGSSGQAAGLGLYGTAQFNASISGSLASPQIQGKLQAANLRVKGSAWKALRADLSANPSVIVLQNGELQSATRGHFAFNVRAGLAHWSYSPNSPINVNLSASQLSLADLEKFAGKEYPIAGTLAMNVSVHGSQLNPVGQGNITIANGAVSDQPVQNLNLTFQGDGNLVNANLAVRLPAGSAEANAKVDPKTRAYSFELHGHNIRLEELQAVKARNMQIAGGMNLDASGRGTLNEPELNATLSIPQLQVRRQTLHGMTLQATVRNNVATLNLDSQVEQAQVKAHGTIGIKAPYMADVRLDTGRIDFQPLVALYSPAQAASVGGQTELHVTVRGPLADKRRVEAHLEIPSLTAAYKQFHIASAKPIRVDYQNSTAVLQPTSLEGTDTSINMQATVPVSNPNAAILTLKGKIDLAVIQLLSADLQSSGQIVFDVGSRGVGPSAGMGGQIRIVDASLHPADIPVGLDHANGVIQITPTRLDVASFQGEMGGGKITANGGVAFRPAVQFNLGLEGDNVRLRYPEGIRALLATKLALTGSPQASMLAGQVRIQRISFTPDFDLTSFTEQFGGETSAPAATGGFTQSLRLNIALQSTSQMNLESSQVSAHGNVNLRVEGTGAQPVLLGRADLTGGELFFGGNRYVIPSGTIDFLNPIRTEPVLNLQAQTKINDYNITLTLQGPIDRLHTTYTSDPALPPADIINLIARGQTTEAAAAQPSQPLSLGAQSLVASTVSGQIGNKLAKVAGISQLQIDPSLGANNGQNPGARIAIQQRVTSSLFVTFATDVTSTQREAIEVEYQLNPRWSVTGVRDQNGGITAQAHYKKKF